MGNCFLHGNGGSSGLNFRIVGGTSAPDNPKENTLWVNTDVKITSYSIGSANPNTAGNGGVHIYTKTSGAVSFNALKKNYMEIVPIKAQQLRNSEWVDVDVRLYKAGKWETFVVFLYDRGDQRADESGGWSKQNRSDGGSYFGHSVSFGSEQISFSSTYAKDSHQANGSVETNSLVDLSQFSKLQLTYTKSSWGNDNVKAYFGIGSSRNGTTAEVKLSDSSAETTAALEISGVNTSQYVYIRATSGTGDGSVTVNIREVYLI